MTIHLLSLTFSIRTLYYKGNLRKSDNYLITDNIKINHPYCYSPFVWYLFDFVIREIIVINVAYFMVNVMFRTNYSMYSQF